MGRLDKLYIGTNTKMYKTTSEICSYLSRLLALTRDIPDEILELFVLPSFTSLDAAKKTVKDSKLRIGAQNMGWEEKGAFTGEISPAMIGEAGADIVMTGHSERRRILRETNQDEEKKTARALKNGFTALLCIGEDMEEKEYGICDEILRIQLKTALHSVTQAQAERLWIAYEPVWAIGDNGTPASESYANERHSVIKETLRNLYGDKTGSDIPVLYGGSVNNRNAEALIRMPFIDGLFIGRSAWDAADFAGIIRAVLPVFREKRRRGT